MSTEMLAPHLADHAFGLLDVVRPKGYELRNHCAGGA
jgi:hypothetical protein